MVHFLTLRMREWKSNIGPDVQIHCIACQQSRGMLEAVGPKAADEAPHVPAVVIHISTRSTSASNLAG